MDDPQGCLAVDCRQLALSFTGDATAVATRVSETPKLFTRVSWTLCTWRYMVASLSFCQFPCIQDDVGREGRHITWDLYHPLMRFKVHLASAVSGPCPSNSGGVARLGIPGMCFDDGRACILSPLYNHDRLANDGMSSLRAKVHRLRDPISFRIYSCCEL